MHRSPDTTRGLGRLPIDTVAVATNGSTAAIEQARGALDAAYPATVAAETLGELQADSTRDINSYRQLADVVILINLSVAGCSLAVNIAVLTAQLFLRAQLRDTVRALGSSYYLVVLAGLSASVAVIASTLPLL